MTKLRKVKNNSNENMKNQIETLVGMRLVAVGSEVQGRVRAVYADDEGEYVIISGERIYLDADAEKTETKL